MTNNKHILSENLINNKKINFLDLQLVATLGFIFALILSFLLSYDKKLSLENKRRLFTKKQAQDLSLLQTLLLLIVSLTFLFLNYNQYKLAKFSNSNDQNDLLLQIETSIFAIISAIIGIYIVIKNRNNNLQISEELY